MPQKLLYAAIALLLTTTSFTVRSADAPDIDTINKALQRTFPQIRVEAIHPTPFPGLYQVEIGADVFYVSADGRFVVIGNLIDTSNHRNLTEDRRRTIVAGILGKLEDRTTLIIGPKKAKRTLTVFTDVDCPWCARIHQDVPALNKEGVRVRYLFFPRGGTESETYKRSVAVWCASDRAKAIGIAKSGGQLEMKTCSNPVKEHYDLGRQLGVEGTPTMFLDDGTRIGGYVPVPKLLAAMGIKPQGTPTAAR